MFKTYFLLQHFEQILHVHQAVSTFSNFLFRSACTLGQSKVSRRSKSTKRQRRSASISFWSLELHPKGVGQHKAKKALMSQNRSGHTCFTKKNMSSKSLTLNDVKCVISNWPVCSSGSNTAFVQPDLRWSLPVREAKLLSFQDLFGDVTMSTWWFGCWVWLILCFLNDFLADFLIVDYLLMTCWWLVDDLLITCWSLVDYLLITCWLLVEGFWMKSKKLRSVSSTSSSVPEIRPVSLKFASPAIHGFLATSEDVNLLSSRENWFKTSAPRYVSHRSRPFPS